MKLYQYIIDILPTLKPSLNLANVANKNQRSSAFISGSKLPEIPTSTATIKALEDQLDALLCAYIGAHWWYWGIERNLVLGDRTTGYIVELRYQI
jgi:predicted RNase H-like nuclease